MSSEQVIRTVPHRTNTQGGASFLGRLFHASELPRRAFRSMGTVATVTVRTDYAERLVAVTEHIRKIFDRLESKMSAYRADSEISLLSRMGGVEPISVSEDTDTVLSLARHFGGLSAGAFDSTAGPLMRLWGFNGAQIPPVRPSEQAVREVLKLVDYRRLTIQDGTAFLPVKGMEEDVGGIAKGYAVDLAYDYCLSVGIRNFLIDFGGNVRASGRPEWGTEWQIGVRNPFDRSRIIGKIALPGGTALATSGSYERYVEIAGARFSHIIDPRSGYPATGTASVTVLCKDATTADALSTAFFVVGACGAHALLEKVPSAELLIVPDTYPMELLLTQGLRETFAPAPEVRSRVLSPKS